MHRAGIYSGIFFVIFLAISLYADGSKTIIAEGRASLANVNAEIARERAIENALRAAVEEGTGIFLSSQSRSQNYQLISDNIIANSSGYVSEYKILSERQASGFYIIRVSAVVKTGNIERDLQAIGLLLERKNLPRLMVLVSESWQSHPLRDETPNRQTQAEAGIAAAFLEKGFLVIDSQAIMKSRERDQAILALKGDMKAASVLGKLHEAELVVVGEVKSQSRGNIVGSNFISVSSTITIKVIQSDTGEILTAKSWNSSGAGLDELAASSASIKRGVDRVSTELISDIVSKWAKDTSGTHNIQILVQSIRMLEDLTYLEKTLTNQIPGIKQLYRRNFGTGTAILDAKISGETDALSSEIQRKVFGRYKVIVVGTSANMLKLKIEYLEQQKIN